MMKISRHARNNLRLYKIGDADLISALASPDREAREGERRVAIKKFPGRWGGYPLKVVYQETGEGTLIITAYPLKKKHWG